jgi:hypothetical protein
MMPRQLYNRPTFRARPMSVPDKEWTMCTIRSLIFGIVLASVVIGPSPSFAQSTQGRTVLLKNDDIVKMVQAGLDDTIIIAKIKSSQCDFDTSTDSLISLKKRGVSSAVLSTSPAL